MQNETFERPAPKEQILQDDLMRLRVVLQRFLLAYLHPSFLSGRSARGRFAFRRLVVATDPNPLGKLLARAARVFVKRGLLDSVSLVRVGYPDDGKAEAAEADEGLDPSASGPTLTILCVDCEKADLRDEWLSVLRRLAGEAAGDRRNLCTVASILPACPPAPEGIEGLSEREFSWFLETQVPDKTPGQRFLLDLEAACRSIVAGGFERIDLCRIDGLYGPFGHCLRYFDLHETIRTAFREGVVRVGSGDFDETVSLTYTVDAVRFLVHVAYAPRHGHVYNFVARKATVADVKFALRKLFPDRLALEVAAAPAGAAPSCRTLNTLKLHLAHWKPKLGLTLGAAIYRTACALLDIDPENRTSVSIYGGRLDRIKALEMQMLRDVDAFCERHGIRYFLCGGTMLGAIRYGHSIPWDDDLDIGFLRDDFDKFRTLYEKEMGPLFSYSSHNNRSGSGYIVDKVRLDGSYFSTRYSSEHVCPDGLFIDCLVYDKTSDRRWLATLHSRTVRVLSQCIEVRWHNRPRKGPNFLRERIMAPLLRPLPLRFYTWLFERVIRLYRRKRTFKYVIDSTGKLQWQGPMLARGLLDVKRVPFDEGFSAPIPADPTDYLEFDYGPEWLPEPTLSRRVAPHNFARIDLGEFLLENRNATEWRAVDVRGELFERE